MGTLRVLVVDDCADTRRTLGMLVRLWGHGGETAADGETALELAPRFCPDAVLLDVGLPGMDGYEVCRRLRRLPGLDRALVVAATGYGTPTYCERSHAAGFDRHLVKPVDLAEVQRLLAERATTVAATSAVALSKEELVTAIP